MEEWAPTGHFRLFRPKGAEYILPDYLRTHLASFSQWMEPTLAQRPDLAADLQSVLQLLAIARSGRPFSFSVRTSGLQGAQQREQPAGLVSSRHEVWKILFPEEVIRMRELRCGMTLQHLPEPALSLARADNPALSRLPRVLPNELESMREFRRSAERDGFIRRHPWTPGWLNMVFSTPKASGGLRWIVGMKRFNKQLKKLHFKMQAIRTMARELPRDSWMTVWDYSTFFWLFRVDAAWERMQCFHLPNDDGSWSLFSQPVCVMGCSQSPLRTSTFSHLVARKMASFLMRMFVYCDEGLQHSTCEPWSYTSHHMVLILTHLLGLIRSIPKDRGIPSMLVSFLGWLLASDCLRIAATTVRFMELKQLAAPMCEAALQGQQVLLRTKARLLGVIASMTDGVRRIRLRTVRLQYDFNRQLRSTGGDYDALVPAPPELAPILHELAELQWTDNWNYLRLAQAALHLCAGASECRWAGENPADGFLVGDFLPSDMMALDHHNRMEHYAKRMTELAAVRFYGVRGTVRVPFVIETGTDNAAVVCVSNKLKTSSLAIAEDHLPHCVALE